ncbi:orotate phosphoribosyltransferase [Roseomonas sp. M0104]|uniref:Orotate phosphoribosyltransferase n=1 Tax=Teichococcus coralli TaxID=2545983 RepID=A0A845BEX7_9PROT|nr:phosphoribosyltransferase family protein [Pseudoroseomonas coralli]MXP65378.1 orotate phosphoribosyltransferase [Pseudoroseomonas coralli]
MTERTGASMARLLLEGGAVQISGEQPFILAAGWASPAYVDCRLLIGEPRLRRAAVALAAAAVREALPAMPEIVAGAETAGIPWAAWLAEALDRPLRYVRKRPLGIGRNAQVEGGAVEGRSALLVDDLTTDGSSKATFVRGLRAAGAAVTHGLCLFHHGTFPGGAERLAGLGLSLVALASWRDVLAVRGACALPAAERAVLERFLSDPVAWSAAHGGRAMLERPAL